MNSKILQEPAVCYFLEVVRCGSISEAANRLNVASSAISRQIARLEASLDTLLFERKARGMTPSAAGELLAAYALRVQLETDRVGNEIMALRGLHRGDIKLACTGGFALEFVPQVIAAFRRKHPRIKFNLKADTAANVNRLLREGRVDIGLTFSQVPEEDIHVQTRIKAPIMAIMSHTHELANKRQVLLSQLAAYPLGLPERGIVLRNLFDACCSRQGMLAEPVFSSNSISALLAFAQHDEGIVLSSELLIRNMLAKAQLRAVPIRDRDMSSLNIEICTLAGRVLPEATKAFMSHLTETLTVCATNDAESATIDSDI